ncbi:tetratricopeptide repeat protein 36-like [Styela clava]
MDSDISTSDKKVLQIVFNPNLPVGNLEDIEEPVDDESSFDPEKLATVKNLELKGVKHAEANRLEDALECMNQAIEILPDYPASYNNRAQARRIKGLNQEAYDDLEKAITLSKGKGRTASLAFTQRALLRKLDGNEEGSLEDFKLAAQLGNQFAKQQVVNANPYAALCNKMLSEAMEKLSGNCTKE